MNPTRPLPSLRLTLTLLVLATCDSSSPDEATATVDRRGAKLQKILSCEEAERMIEDRLVAEANGPLEAQLRSLLDDTGTGAGGRGGLIGTGSRGGAGGSNTEPGGWGGFGGSTSSSGSGGSSSFGGWTGSAGGASSIGGAAGGASVPGGGTIGGSPAEGSAPSAHTGTNTQVATVDEPDFIKTDGKRIFALRNARLYMARSWPPEALAVVADLHISRHAQDMFLDEEGRVVVISQAELHSASSPALGGRSGSTGGWGGAGGSFGGSPGWANGGSWGGAGGDIGGAGGGDIGGAAGANTDPDAGASDGGSILFASAGGAPGSSGGFGGGAGTAGASDGQTGPGGRTGEQGVPDPDGNDQSCRPDECGQVPGIKITVVQVNGERLEVVGESYLPGEYRGARRLGPAVRIVTFRRMGALPWGLRGFVEGVDEQLRMDRPTVEALFRVAREHNNLLIRARPLSHWLPPTDVQLGNGQAVESRVDCTELLASSAPEAPGFLTVATLDLRKPKERPARTTVIAGANTLYASASALYVATPTSSDFSSSWADRTVVHKFDTSRPEGVTHLASGVFEGNVLNQFSLDEHDGHLRVATSGISRDDGLNMQVNRIQVLRQQGSNLEVVGKTGALAAGESIMSARFMGPRGFVVTFRQIDPLFTFDLSNPANPRQVGELKVPGYSTYLHPLGANHLIGLGLHVPAPGPWQPDSAPTGPKLSIFDVSDFAHPREVSSMVLSAGGSSTALHDHRGFTFMADKNLLALPLERVRTELGSNAYFAHELHVLTVDAGKGFTRLGAMEMTDLLRHTHGWATVGGVDRSVIATDERGQHFVYAIASGGLRVAPLTDLAHPVASGKFTTTR